MQLLKCHLFMTLNNFKIILIIVTGFVGILSANAQELKKDSVGIVNIRYGAKGFEFQTNDGKYLLHIQSRFQFRVATPYDGNPIVYDDFLDENAPVLKINRARLKVGGARL